MRAQSNNIRLWILAVLLFNMTIRDYDNFIVRSLLKKSIKRRRFDGWRNRRESLELFSPDADQSS
jgi:hypothetical protein